MLSTLPFFINQAISSAEGKKLADSYKDKFPELHQTIKQHQEMHSQVMTKLNSKNSDESI